MREIKFRAWDNTNKEFIDLDKRRICIDYEGDVVELLYSDDGERIRTDYNYIDNITIMQHTGRIDKNGVEIYKGDIVNYKEIIKAELVNGFHEYENRTCEVIWSKDRWCLDCKELETLFSIDNSVEVIGNIYESTELLEQS